jgi:hypothetical protein
VNVREKIKLYFVRQNEHHTNNYEFFFNIIPGWVHSTRGYEETSFFWNDVVVRYKSTHLYSKSTTPAIPSRQHRDVTGICKGSNPESHRVKYRIALSDRPSTSTCEISLHISYATGGRDRGMTDEIFGITSIQENINPVFYLSSPTAFSGRTTHPAQFVLS